MGWDKLSDAELTSALKQAIKELVEADVPEDKRYFWANKEAMEWLNGVNITKEED